jgi:hypothetical protein
MRKFRSNITVLPAQESSSASRLIVIASGYRLKASLEWACHLDWLSRYATVAVVDHPDRGFSLNDEARHLLACITEIDPEEIWIVGSCMGMQVARRLVRLLRRRNLVGRLRGLVIPCGYNGVRYMQGPPPVMWWLLAPVYTTDWYVKLMHALAPYRRPQPSLPPREPGTDPAAITAWRAYSGSLPYLARLRQILAGLFTLRLRAGEWAGLRAAQIAVHGDLVIDAEASADSIAAAHPGMTTIWLGPDEAGHVTLPLHPRAWARGLSAGFGATGLVVDLATFSAIEVEGR